MRAALLYLLSLLFPRRRPTVFDVFFAYRLILLRRPDAEGWRHQLGWIRSGGASVEALSNAFLLSPEFEALRGKLDVRRDYAEQPVEEMMVETGEFAIFVDRRDQVIGGVLAEGRPYEPHVVRVLRALLQKGQTFADVGANIGYFSLLAAGLVGAEGHVIAFEPVPFNYGLLEKSIAQNGFTNVELHRKAVLASDGAVEMLQFERRNSGSFHLRSASDGEDPAGARVTADAVRFDDALAGRPVHFVKIDVEGAEGLVVQGMANALRAHRPLLVVEYAPQALAEVSKVSGEEFLRTMRDLGYAAMDTRSFDGRLEPESPAQIERALRRAGHHLDLLFFPR